MEHLIKLVEKRKDLGKTKSYKNGGNFNDLIEYKRLGELIVEEVCHLYDEGKLRI